ncbi:pentatricopeptide repeat-containing protein At5g52850, chloroplastic isoform X2 [Andrographis paniculata]|uniref:pentatricopeptide repeat-containing protein At5g52850, chloroplastic isoform X2 n=1 Tax=Andrographis paniculata TaxID=175694 RepID=UPI0021E7EA1B|nr:pentatricopeptide repeat-containing protein At5g52850, chloroplastic isoform X2 [Andrographis paniculata]
MLGRSLLEETCSRIVSFCNKNSLKDGLYIHSPAIKLGIKHNLVVTNNLLSLYAKCSGVGYARYLFDEMSHRDVVSWTSVMSAYVKNGSHTEALSFFDSMKISGTIPNEFTFSNVLRSCSALGDLVHATGVHGSIIKQGFESNPILCSTLIELYSKCGLLQEAVRVFAALDNGDTVSWTAMVSSLVEAGDHDGALRLFNRMIEEKVFPNEYTFVKLLGACRSSDHARLVHSQSIIWGARLNLVLKTALVSAYAKLRKMDDAVMVAKQTPEEDQQLWTAVITGFAHSLNFCEAVTAFRQMMGRNVTPNNYSYAAILNVCASPRALQLGRQVHAQVVVTGLEIDVSLGNALLDLYVKCSIGVEDVVRVFNQITLPNVASWSTLIVGMAARDLKDRCFRAFLAMRRSGQQPNSFTLVSVLQACGKEETRKIHGFIVKTNSDSDAKVGNALVEAYTGSQLVDCAMRFADGMNNKSIVTYTVLASKLNQTGRHRLTLDTIKYVHDNSFLMDGFMLSTFLSACANQCAMQIGRQIHCCSISSGFGRQTSVLNSLIDFYGNCKSIEDALKAFSEISDPDIISWNTLMHSYVLTGQTSSALSTLEDMRLAGVRPDSVTMSTVMLACMVDLLGKAGRVEEAVSFLQTMPISPNATTYKRLLLACKLHGHVLLGEEMARQGLKLDPSDSEFDAILATIYDNASRFDLGDSVRSRMTVVL